MVTHQDVLTSLQWEYIILDEGHKIRNPDAKVGACDVFLSVLRIQLILIRIRNRTGKKLIRIQIQVISLKFTEFFEPSKIFKFFSYFFR